MRYVYAISLCIRYIKKLTIYNTCDSLLISLCSRIVDTRISQQFINHIVFGECISLAITYSICIRELFLRCNYLKEKSGTLNVNTVTFESITRYECSAFTVCYENTLRSTTLPPLTTHTAPYRPYHPYHPLPPPTTPQVEV